MATLRKINNCVDWLFMAACMALLAVIIGASFLQVFTRYVLNNAIIGSEEVCRYAFIWMSMLGASLCVRRWMHPAVTVLTDFLGPRARKCCDILVNILIVAITLTLGWASMRILGATRNQMSAVLEFRMSHIYLAIPIGCAGMAYNALVNLAGILAGKGFAGDRGGK